MAAHSYWRLRSTCAFGSQIGLNELEMAATTGGTNLCTGGTPFTSTTYGGFYAVTKAFDGNITDGSVWAGPDKYGTIGYQFAAPVEINEIRIAPYSDIFDTLPRILRVESSDDGVTYTLEWVVITYNNVTYNTISSFPRQPEQDEYRYWALLNFEGAGGSGYRDMVVVEAEFRETPGGADATGSGTALASASNGGGQTEASAFDNNNGTLFYSGYPIPPDQYLGYDFGSGNDKQITEIMLRGDPNTGNLNRAPGTGLVIASTDRRGWRAVGAYASLVYTSNVALIEVGEAPEPTDVRRRLFPIVN